MRIILSLLRDAASMVEPESVTAQSVEKIHSSKESLPPGSSQESPHPGNDISALVESLHRDLTREKQKITSLYFVIGGIISFEAGRLLTPVHELFAISSAVVAVILSIYGFFNYFDAYHRS